MKVSQILTSLIRFWRIILLSLGFIILPTLSNAVAQKHSILSTGKEA